MMHRMHMAERVSVFWKHHAHIQYYE